MLFLLLKNKNRLKYFLNKAINCDFLQNKRYKQGSAKTVQIAFLKEMQK